jgi:TRAP-type C4-dicarboxylate transport system permease small subunit
MNLLERFQKPMDFFLKAGALVSAAGMLGVVFLQVFSRAFLPQTPHWTEEAARITFVYTASFAAGLAVKNRTYVRVDTLINRLPAKAKALLEAFVSLAVAGFMVLSAWLSLTMVRLGAMQLSPSLRKIGRAHV